MRFLYFIIGLLLLGACGQDSLEPVANEFPFPEKLSDHAIFSGPMRNLTPATGYYLYELANPLFSDYAEKQRLIKLPPGTQLTGQGDGLPDFPDQTMIVKTFYYPRNQRNVFGASADKIILETRLLVKRDTRWSVATYAWNDAQTEAYLLTSGLDHMVNWMDKDGRGRVVAYHIPSNRECATCHHAAGEITPIGPKLRNLNTEVARNGETVNQLDYWQDEGLLAVLNRAHITRVPVVSNAGEPLADRARAYLDSNCAHCHNPSGHAKDTDLFFDYERSRDSGISRNENQIVQQMEQGTMPRLGTTLIHEEGLQLIKDYINALP